MPMFLLMDVGKIIHDLNDPVIITSRQFIARLTYTHLKMTVAGGSGVTGALLALLTFGFILNFLDTGPFLNGKEAPCSLPVHQDTVKHFGYGKHALMEVLVFTAVQHQHKHGSEVRGKCQRDNVIIITLYLLLSRDIHQCPGPNIGNVSHQPNLLPQVCCLASEDGLVEVSRPGGGSVSAGSGAPGHRGLLLWVTRSVGGWH